MPIRIACITQDAAAARGRSGCAATSPQAADMAPGDQPRGAGLQPVLT
jgi:hypothetical protein